jgi:hypothetical protein
MFVHLVLIKLKPGITRVDPRVRVWHSMFTGLERKCKGITRFEHGWNTTDRPIAYDYGINMAFGTRSSAPGGRREIARHRRLGDLRL